MNKKDLMAALQDLPDDCEVRVLVQDRLRPESPWFGKSIPVVDVLGPRGPDIVVIAVQVG
jgi:hypothetical protein